MIELEIFIAILIGAVMAALVLLWVKIHTDRRLRNAIDALWKAAAP